MTVREYIEPMYKIEVSIQACNEYAIKDFHNEANNKNRFYCHNKPVNDIKTENDFKKILEYKYN